VKKIFFLLAALGFTTACQITPMPSPATNTTSPYPVRIESMTNKTVNNLVLIYMAAENNLANAAVMDMLEIERAISNFRKKGDDVLVYIDVVKNMDEYEYYLDNSPIVNSNGWYLYPGGVFEPVGLSTEGYMQAKRVHTNKNNNSGDPEDLREFLAFAKSKYNYNKVFLVLWNHGSSFYPMGTNVTFAKDINPYKGAASPLFIGYDEISQDSLSDEEIKWAISKTLTNVEAIGFDGCVMGNIEVAYEYRNITKNYVASVNVEPVDGWPYDVWMSRWAAQGNTDMQSLTRMLVDAFREVYATNDTGIHETLYSMKMPESITGIIAEYRDMATYILNDTNIAKAWMMGQYYFQWEKNKMYDMTFDQNAKGIVLEYMMSNIAVNTAHAGMDSLYSAYQNTLANYVYTSTNGASPTFYKPWTLYNAKKEIAGKWYGPQNIKLLFDYPNLYTITTAEDYILDEKTIEMFIDYTRINFFLESWNNEGSSTIRPTLSGFYLDNPDGVGSFDNFVLLTNNLIHRTNAVHMADFEDHFYKFIVTSGGTFRLWVATDEGLDLWNYFPYSDELIAIYDDTRTMLAAYTSQDNHDQGYAMFFWSDYYTKDSSSVTNSINATHKAYFLDTTLSPGTYYLRIRTLLSIGKPFQRAPYIMWVGTNSTATLN